MRSKRSTLVVFLNLPISRPAAGSFKIYFYFKEGYPRVKFDEVKKGHTPTIELS